MQSFEDTANDLHSYLTTNYPNGLATTAILRENRFQLDVLTLMSIMRDYQHLFETRTTTGNPRQFVLVPKNHAVQTRKVRMMRMNTVEEVVLEFYNKYLRDDPILRQSCEDRNRFTEEFNSWKEVEARKGRLFRGCSPSSALRALKEKLKLVDAVANGDVIIWTDRPDSRGRKKTLNRKERIKIVISKVKHSRAILEKNRDGVEIDSITFGHNYKNGDIARVRTDLTQQVKITNNAQSVIRVVINDGIAFKRGVTVRVLEPDARKEKLIIYSGKSAIIDVSYTPKEPGVMKCILTFEITKVEEPDSKPFTIVRYIAVRGGDPDDYDILKPVAPYQRKEAIERGAFSNPERVEKEDRSDRNTRSESSGNFKDLRRFGIPRGVRNSIASGGVSDEVVALFYQRSDIPAELPADFSSLLTTGNYRKIFQLLLWMEEAQMEVDIKNYDMVNAPLEKFGRMYSIHVPGLAESRPSVLRGDTIKIRCNRGCFEGIVERTEQENAIITFPRSMNSNYINGMRVDIRFSFKRMAMRLCHDGLDSLLKSTTRHNMMKKVLFPNYQRTEPLPAMITKASLTEINFYNRELNDQQRMAVKGVMKSVFRPAPYIIFGPPGTGKTVTLVESILQTIKSKGANKSSRLLVCAPSNTATDLLMQRLSPYLLPKEMLRVLAFSRDKSSVPADVLAYSYYSDNENGFVIPPTDFLKQKQVVCVTITTAGKLPYHGQLGHFSHVFIDEAGHALEPEALSCIAKTTQAENLKDPPAIILAGDPKQLGPIVRSNEAKSFGLEKSMLERLYHRLTENEEKDNRIMTKLVQNYRSHPKILKLASSRFYNNILIPKGDPFTTHSLQTWEHLPDPAKRNRFPLIFHGVEGQDSREQSSPSWFNSEECQIVKKYVDLLVKQTRINKVKPEDIGIVTPYHKQVQKIKMLLRAHGYGECKVGSVEEFQGSEKRVIIISTVRSSIEYLKYDNKHQLGFVSNSKRFNVAITRAQALLIVIGNPRVLKEDPDWKSFIDYCNDGGGYVGCSMGNDDISEVDDMSITSSIEDDREEDDEGYGAISATTGQEGPAWRSEE